MAHIPKNIPTLFQLPITVDVMVLNTPKDRNVGPIIILKIKNKAKSIEDKTKAKNE